MAQPRAQRRNPPKAKAIARFDVRTVNVLLGILAVALFVGYLIMNSSASTKGFAMRAIERQISDLEDAQRRLDVETLSTSSMKQVEEQVTELGLVPVDNVDYLDVTPPSVAVK